MPLSISEAGLGVEQDVPLDRSDIEASKIIPFARLDEDAGHQADQVV